METTYDISEAAAYLGIAVRMVARLRDEHILGSCRDSARDGEQRYTKTHLDEYVARGRYCTGKLPA